VPGVAEEPEGEDPVACLVGGLGGQLTLRSFELVIDWPLKIKNPKPSR